MSSRLDPLSGDRIPAEGGVFLTYYVAYTLYLVLGASHHDALAGFGAVMLYFVMPVTVMTLVVLSIQEARRRRAGER